MRGHRGRSRDRTLWGGDTHASDRTAVAGHQHRGPVPLPAPVARPHHPPTPVGGFFCPPCYAAAGPWPRVRLYSPSRSCAPNSPPAGPPTRTPS